MSSIPDARVFLGMLADNVREQTDDNSSDKQVRLGTVDPSYVSGDPRVLFDGDTVMAMKGFKVLGDYIPAGNDRVMMQPIGNSYVVVGKVSSPAPVVGRWENQTNAVALPTGDTKVPFPVAVFPAQGITKSADHTGFTVSRSGLYGFSGNLHMDAPVANTNMWGWVGKSGSSDPRWALAIIPIPVTGWYAFAFSTENVPLNANDSVSVYIYFSGGAKTINPGDTAVRRATNFAIKRTGNIPT